MICFKFIWNYGFYNEIILLLFTNFRFFRETAKNDYYLYHGSLCVCTEQFDSHDKDFREKLYLDIFRNYVEKIQFWLKSEKITGTLHDHLCTFTTIALWILLRIINFSDKICRAKTDILCSVTLFRKSCRLWSNVEKYFTAGHDADDNMDHAHWMLDT